MVQDVERDETKFQFGDKEDVFSVAGVLKQCKLTVFSPQVLADRQIYVNCQNQYFHSHTQRG